MCALHGEVGAMLLKVLFSDHQHQAVSWLNASEQLCLSTLYQGGTSHCLELGGPSTVALDVVLHRGVLSTGSVEGSHLLGLGECSGTSTGGTDEADGCPIGEAPCDKENGWDEGACPISRWKEAASAPLNYPGLAFKAAWQAERSQSDSYLPLGWFAPPGVWWPLHVACGVTQPVRPFVLQLPCWL